MQLNQILITDYTFTESIPQTFKNNYESLYYKIIGDVFTPYMFQDAIDFKKLNETHSDVPFFNVSAVKVKVPAAWLIEKCGFKGKKEGNTGTHKAHALIIVNYGKATGKEIFYFSQKIKNAVLRKFNILLEEEVNIIEN